MRNGVFAYGRTHGLRGFILLGFVLLGLAQPALSQKIPVTIRDFSESHPDMQSSNCEGLRRGMVEQQLGADRKPVHTKKECPDSKVDEWFRDTPDNKRYCRDITFTPKSGTESTVEYLNENFFPLDDVDLANQVVGSHDQKPHNYYFCMEMHSTFKYRGGEVFDFEGDDDVWVFINGKLALDLGGEHSKQSGSVNLDNQAIDLGISVGSFYNFDFFFCERNQTHSHLLATTSLDLRPPESDGLKIADGNSIIIPSNEVITLYQGREASEFYAVELTSKEETIDCNDVSTQEQNPVAGAWTLAGKSLGTSQSVSINPDDFPTGRHKLQVTKGSSYSINVEIVAQVKLSTPKADPPGKSFKGTLDVRLTQAEGATMYYTLGDKPFSTQDWKRYTGAIAISEASTLKAIAVKDGLLNSDIMVETYGRDLPKALYGFFLDENKDGRIESAIIRFDEAYVKAPKEVDLLDPFSRKPIESEIRIENLGSQNSIRLRFDPLEFGTSFQEGELATIVEWPGEFRTQKVPMRDSVGPQLIKVESFPPQEGRRPQVRLKFSEPITFSGDARDMDLNVLRLGKTLLGNEFKVEEVLTIGPDHLQLVLAENSNYPAVGDSLKLAKAEGLTDRNGYPYSGSGWVPVEGRVPRQPTRIDAEIVNPVTESDQAWKPSDVTRPSIILGPGDECADCGPELELDGVLPGVAVDRITEIAPSWTVTTKYAFNYSLKVYDHLGQFVNEAKGSMDEQTFAKLPRSAQDSVTVRLVVLPMTKDQEEFPNGAYILRGEMVTREGEIRDERGIPVTITASRRVLFQRFGYVRKNR